MAYLLVNQWRWTDKCEFKIQPEIPRGAIITLKVKETAAEAEIIKVVQAEGKET
jgi:hypothetical protein